MCVTHLYEVKMDALAFLNQTVPVRNWRIEK
jgi:hypothetical protein